MKPIDGSPEQERINPARDGAQPSSGNPQGPAEPRRKTSGRRKKRRGAPLGNQNARKHGYYSRHLTPEQIKLLPRARAHAGYDEEIAVMRLKIAALMSCPDTSPELFLRAMRTLMRMVENSERIRLML